MDKGFLIENECALLGIICIRPMKMLDKQTQQSAEDTALTQKVGKTRIPIEQANGQMKRGTAFFDRKIRIDQIGLADLIFRSSYLLTNFNLPFIQERHVAEESEDGRPCSAEIRYYGGTDEGLVDVRPYVELWGMDIEIPRWHTLRQNPIYEHFSDTEISELLLAEDWPGKMKKEHLDAVKQCGEVVASFVFFFMHKGTYKYRVPESMSTFLLPHCNIVSLEKPVCWLDIAPPGNSGRRPSIPMVIECVYFVIYCTKAYE